MKTWQGCFLEAALAAAIVFAFVCAGVAILGRGVLIWWTSR